MASRECPNCHSKRNWKDGWRDIATGSVQRFICRDCGYRFTDPNSLNVQSTNKENSRISANKVKNMVLSQKINICARDEELPQDAIGLIAQLCAYMEKEGFSSESQYPNHIRRLAKLGANLRDPEDVKAVIGRQKVKNGMKLQYVYAYTALLTMQKLTWNRPKYKQEEIIPHIPYENELDALITGTQSRRMAGYLQCLKETFGDPSEVLRIKWIDVNEKEQTITINYPVKGHLPRTLQVSTKLLAMLNCLPKDNERIFPTTYQSMAYTYHIVRKRVADIQKNPRILSIELRSFRHWGGTMIAQTSNGNVLLVKKLLGHKRIENSMKYIGMIDFKINDYEETTATTIEEIRSLGKAGWSKYDEMAVSGTQIHFYRRPKRFSKL